MSYFRGSRATKAIDKIHPDLVTSRNCAGIETGEKFAGAIRYLQPKQRLDVFKEAYGDPQLAGLAYQVTEIPWQREILINESEIRHLFAEHLSSLIHFQKEDPNSRWDAAMSSSYSTVFGLTMEKSRQRDETYADLFSFAEGWARTGHGPDFDEIITLSRNAAYEAADELLDLPNPWQPLVNIYKRGLHISVYRDHELILDTGEGARRLKI